VRNGKENKTGKGIAPRCGWAFSPHQLGGAKSIRMGGPNAARAASGSYRNAKKDVAGESGKQSPLARAQIPIQWPD